MYKLLRPILFLFQPETIHHLIVGLLKACKYIPLSSCMIRLFFKRTNSKLEREVFGLKFTNPVGFAAGFDKDAEIANQLSDFGFGFVEVGTVTPKPQEGNPKPRCFRLPEHKAVINRMGFNSKGVDHMVAKLSTLKRRKGLIVGGNIGKNTSTPNESAFTDYTSNFIALYPYVDYFTVNISCPNVTNLCSLQNKDSVAGILKPLVEYRKQQKMYKPVLLKLSPDLTFEQVDEQLEVGLSMGIDGIVATNTTTSRNGINEQRANEIGKGGLSGAPLTQRSLEMVHYIRSKTTLPIIGVGGIMTAADALNMLKAGATLIQVYTGFIYQGPSFAKRINKRLAKEL